MDPAIKKRLRGILLMALAAVALYLLVGAAVNIRFLRQGTAVPHIPGLEVTYLLTPAELAELRVDDNFDVTASGTVILKSGSDLVGITTALDPSRASRMTVSNSRISSFAVDEGDRLLTVADGYLGMLGENNESSHAVPLPYDDARIARSIHEGVIYLFGGKQEDYRLYRFIDDGTFQVLLKSGDPIVAVADTHDTAYAATANTIVRIEVNGPTIVFKGPDQPDWGPIISLAASPDEGLLFFTTPSQIYALDKGFAVSVANDAGGGMRLRGDTLYLLDRKRNLLLSFHPASRALFAKSKR